MKKLVLFVAFSTCISAFGQGGFKFPPGTTSNKIDFQFLSNLVIVPVELNGVTLDFLLDTGVNATILFSIENKDSLQLNNAEPIKLRGLGTGNSIDAIKSTQNTLKIGDAVNRDQTVFIVFDEDLNFSPRLGESVHGIIGYDFYKDFIVETNYVTEKLSFFEPDSYEAPKCKKCFRTPMRFYNNKPYIELDVTIGQTTETVTVLLDSGSGDALWLLNGRRPWIKVPKKHFRDFLGLGLNGNIFGDRSRIDAVQLGNYKLREVNTAFPDQDAFGNINLFKARDGSMGGELLKRFTTIIDYTNRELILRKNRYFNQPFYYNMSGLVLQHNGFEYVKEKLAGTNKSKYGNDPNNVKNEVIIYETQHLYAIKLAPKIEVAEVREGSPAYEAGMRPGDILTDLNGEPIHRYSLQELNAIFHSKEGKLLRFKVNRNGFNLRISFKLRRVI